MTAKVYTIDLLNNMFQVYDHEASYHYYFENLRMAHDYLRSWRVFNQPNLVRLTVDADVMILKTEEDWAIALLKYNDLGFH